MHFVLFTEEPSAEAALLEILPKLIDTNLHSFQILTHGGKNDLIKKLPSKLQSLAPKVAEGYRFIVMIDRDSDNCNALKLTLEQIAAAAGLHTKTNKAPDGSFSVVTRIVIEELESWFMGDPAAVQAAFPGINMATFSQPRYKVPDAIKGGTCEVLERILRRAGYYRAGIAKIDAARNISKHMNPLLNRSHSFQCFMTGIQSF